MKSVRVLGVRFDDLTNNELDFLLENALNGSRPAMIVTPNPEMLLETQRYRWFHQLLNDFDISLPDGIGVVYAAAAVSGASISRHPGVDVLLRIARVCAFQKRRLLLIGGKNGVGEQAAERLWLEQPSLQVRTLDPGIVMLGKQGNLIISETIIQQINEIKPDVIVIALGAKKQEILARRIKQECQHVKLIIGVGGALDMLAEITPRAPLKMRKMGLEWLWRWKLQPRRIKRMFNATIRFPLIIAWGTLRQKRLRKGVEAVFSEMLKNK